MSADVKIFQDGQSGTAIVGLSRNLVYNQEVTQVSIVATEKVSAPTSEADLLTTPSSTRVSEDSAFQVAYEIELLDNADKDYRIEIVDSRGQRGSQDGTDVQVVVLPDSWHRSVYLQKWSRLCWENQRHQYDGQLWWNSPQGLDPTTTSRGFGLINDTTGLDADGDGLADLVPGFDFPVMYEDMPQLFVQDPVYTLRTMNPHKIDSDIPNITIESIGLNLRRKTDIAGVLNPSYGTRWLKHKEIHPEDDPLQWDTDGHYEFAPYPMVDHKQVPMGKPPQPDSTGSGLFGYLNANVSSSIISLMNLHRKEIRREKPGAPTTSVVPVWFGDVLKFYYYIEPYDIVHELDIYYDGQVIKTLSTKNENYKNEGWFEVNAFTGYQKGPMVFKINRYHCSYSYGVKYRSYIDCLDVIAEKPPVWDRSYRIVPESIQGSRNIRIRVLGPIENIYKPTSRETAFTPDVRVPTESEWVKAIKEQKQVLRLSVKKYNNGLEKDLGNYIVNPIATSGGAPDDMLDLDGILSFKSATEGFYMFEFNPHAGVLELMNNVDEDGWYVFRLNWWSAGIEHGLLTGENFAEIRVSEDGKEYRYDSWDEEHPVRRYMRMSPVNPLDDSEDTIINVAENRQGVKIKIDPDTNPAIPQLPAEDTVVSLEDPYWNVMFDTLPRPENHLVVRGYYVTWPYFCFAIKPPETTRVGWIDAEVCVSVYLEPKQRELTGEMAAYDLPQLPEPLVQNMHLASFFEWSDRFELHDFATYQAALGELIRLKKIEQAEQIYAAQQNQNTASTGMSTQTYTPPDPTTGLTAEQIELYEEHLSEIALQCEQDIRERGKIYYYLKVRIEGEQNPRIYPIYEIFPADYGYSDGVRFDYDVIVQEEDNLTFIGTGMEELLVDLVESFTPIGDYGNPDVTTGDTPGLVPAKDFKFPDKVTTFVREKTMEEDNEAPSIHASTGAETI